MNAIEALIAQGIPKKMAERIVSQIEKDAQPKEKKTRKWFPGMAETKKVEIEVDVMIFCDTCGHIEYTKKMIKVSADSPAEHKTGRSTCEHCPDFFRQYNSEQLISIILAGQTFAITHEYRHIRQQMKIAERYTPEQMVVYTPNRITE